uniref:Uncharacterized protein n=1 Tax=Arundo donax TaxID=35708 RepID=A0A0A8XVC1_ARUDO
MTRNSLAAGKQQTKMETKLTKWIFLGLLVPDVLNTIS